MKKYRRFQNEEVEQKFLGYPKEVRPRLLDLRELIFDVALSVDGVGDIEECLKWNEPSFVTSETKSGSSFRIDWKKNDPDRYHIYFNCNTKLVLIFKELFPHSFIFGGNRSISFKLEDKKLPRELTKCIEIALTYNIGGYKSFS